MPNRLSRPQAPDEEFWESTLSAGVLRRPASLRPLPSMPITPEMIQQPAPSGSDPKYPFRLIPAVSPSLRDGRPANLPWLQESPDTLTTIVWDSWAELHPSTAKALQVREGDVLEHSIRARLHSCQSLSDARHPPGLGGGADRPGA